MRSVATEPPLTNAAVLPVALCNVAGTIADLFGDEPGAGQAMALFVSSANIGPSLGSPVGEWLADNVNMGFAWMGWINVIIGFGKALHPALRAHPELIHRCPQRTPSFWSSSQSTFPPTFMQDVINLLKPPQNTPPARHCEGGSWRARRPGGGGPRHHQGLGDEGDLLRTHDGAQDHGHGG